MLYHSCHVVAFRRTVGGMILTPSYHHLYSDLSPLKGSSCHQILACLSQSSIPIILVHHGINARIAGKFRSVVPSSMNRIGLGCPGFKAASKAKPAPTLPVKSPFLNAALEVR